MIAASKSSSRALSLVWKQRCRLRNSNLVPAAFECHLEEAACKGTDHHTANMLISRKAFKRWEKMYGFGDLCCSVNNAATNALPVDNAEAWLACFGLASSCKAWWILVQCSKGNITAKTFTVQIHA